MSCQGKIDQTHASEDLSLVGRLVNLSIGKALNSKDQEYVEAKHLAQEKMIGENKFSFQEKMEIKPEETMAKEATTSEIEGVR